MEESRHLDQWEGEVEVDRDRFLAVLRETRDALDASGVPYLFLGGVASQALGRPRWTHDADVIVAPGEAERALEALARAGFRIQRTDPEWLFKALKDDVLVDLVFRSMGIGDHPPVALDDAMLERATQEEIEGIAIRVLPPEDLVVIKALVWKEHTPRHWHDALAVLRRPDIDWDYLVERARRHDPLRVLSLLLYAESNDTPVPWSSVRDLYGSGMRWSPQPTSPST
jgi:hypothetical protein